MSIKKEGSLAGKALGTNSSSVCNYNTVDDESKVQLQQQPVLEAEAVDNVIACHEDHELGPEDIPQLAAEVYAETLRLVKLGNEQARFSGHGNIYRKPSCLTAAQAADLIFNVEHIRLVCTEENVHKSTAAGILARYNYDGPNYGIYTEIGDGDIAAWSHDIAGDTKKEWQKELQAQLYSIASRDEYRVAETTRSNLVFMANGIYDYENRELMEFDPEIVSLRKPSADLPEVAPQEPVHIMPGGSKLTFWDWIDSLVPYEGGRDLLIQLIGAVLRNNHNWRVMVTLFNKTGQNGKSTFLDFLKALVGSKGVMTSNLATLAGSSDSSGRFGLANIVGVALITCEDSNSGAYIRDDSRLKSIISHDVINVERKHEATFDYRPRCIIVCAANDLPKTKDKGQAWLDRNIYVPFTGEFRGKADRTIREEWVVSPEFLSYAAYQALVVHAPYYELVQPEEAKALKDEFIEDNDSVVEFWHVMCQGHQTDFFPLDWLWDTYKTWLPANRPTTKMPSTKTFMSHVREVAVSEGDWVYPKVPSGKGQLLQKSDWLPFESVGMTVPGNNRQRGLVRRSVYEYCKVNNTTPMAMGKDEYMELRDQLGLAATDED